MKQSRQCESLFFFSLLKTLKCVYLKVATLRQSTCLLNGTFCDLWRHDGSNLSAWFVATCSRATAAAAVQVVDRKIKTILRWCTHGGGGGGGGGGEWKKRIRRHLSRWLHDWKETVYFPLFFSFSFLKLVAVVVVVVVEVAFVMWC